MNTALVSQDRAAVRIAEAFKRRPCCCVQVREQRAFSDGWLCLGTVSLPPHEEPDEDDRGSAEAVGATFEWRLPDANVVERDLAELLDVQKGDDDPRISRVLDQTAAIAVRTGLLHPVFDPAALEEMPFRRGTTVVSDTSGVLQGALDFVVRHLHPAARVKIPAIVQMEFVNFSDRFFKTRKSNEKKARRQKNGKSRLLRSRELLEHLTSQGGQRTLLRLELQADAEIERTYLLGDPLRGAFQPDTDGAVRDLNINVSIPAYADRLILEAARHHQAQSAPDHAVRLLTSDQGLARMAMAEGVTPLYFAAVKYTDFFGDRLGGPILDPFSGDIHSIPLTQVLWELATAFGSARLQWEDGGSITISAMYEGGSWWPFHSVDDLLWFSAEEVGDGASPGGRTNRPAAGTPAEVSGSAPSTVADRATRNASFQRMSVNSLLRLICAMDDAQALDRAQVAALLKVGSSRGVNEYRRFLHSAGLVEIDGDRWVAAPRVRALAAELGNENAAALREALERAPSFAAFGTHVAQSEVGRPMDLSDLSRGSTTYRVLGELTLICATVGRDVYATPTRPEPGTFAQSALRRFGELDGGDGLVAAGRWLESLIRHDGIHPEVARRALEQANEEGLLRRYTEGSTMQTGFDSHVVHVLRTGADGVPVAMPVHLYRGDYLIPGKASVSLRIEGRS